VIPLIIGATGTISKSFRKYLSHLPGKRNQGTTENTHIVHCALTAESADVKVQSIKLEKSHYM